MSKMASADTTTNVLEVGEGKEDNETIDATVNKSTNEKEPEQSPVISSAKAAFGRFWSRSESSEKSVEPTSTAKKSKRRHRDPKTIERANLLNVAKLIIKELIDSSMAHGRMLDDDHEPLQQFFIVLEHILRHGLRPKKSILRDRRDFWCVLELVEKFVPEAAEITATVRDMPRLKTPLGKARAWLRLSAMQKTLADYFKVLIEKRDMVLTEYYEPGAMLIEDEGTVVAGLLVGLNVIDCNLGIKDENLDTPMGVVDFSLYLKDTRLDESDPEAESTAMQEKMQTILDQKNYLEELNRHLNTTVANLQQKLEMASTTNALMKEDLAIAKNEIIELKEEKDVAESQRDTILHVHKHHIEESKKDIDVERQTYQQSRAGLDEMYADVKKRLDEEIQLRLDVEKEMELQISMKQEIEMALQLLEKDIHEKQDTIIGLRKQLEDVKNINLQMYDKLEHCDTSLKHKTEMVSKLEEKTNHLVSVLKENEKKLKQCESDKNAAEETARKLGQTLADKDAKRTALETDLRIEREWRGNLQKNLDTEKAKYTAQQKELQQLRQVEQAHETLQREYRQLQRTCEEQEKTLAELGSHLSESKLRVEDLRELQQVNKEATWASDKEVTNCKQCEKAFSVARRKHHCRNCGEIFCAECSDNKMPHPSSSKPVRVCDSCHEILLQRYSAGGN
ncbi:RUN and FYVE domain-containing protein 2-like isoform X1 [Mya arenaria]|uniref:RUN and FYVE domain-containing protein 2-like isoform X1 n=1 Tax=Mya arenaria TaxID=6604 RepID=UPI0022E48155|nr:RUN and FYVE domain-containing protein 2-like isoform X1 [Mya arenaria]